MKIIQLFFLMLTIGYCAQAKPVTVTFEPRFKDTKLKLNTPYLINEKDTIRIEQLKWYVSNVVLKYKNSTVFAEKNSYHLINVEDEKSLAFTLTVNDDLKFDEIEFLIGIDSATNAQGVIGGDLDPVNGMYWTWQSGYINFKLEGKSSACTSKRKDFIVHLGGYISPFPTHQSCKFKVKNNNSILIEFIVDSYLKTINYSSVPHIMSPGEKAHLLSNQIPKFMQLNQE